MGVIITYDRGESMNRQLVTDEPVEFEIHRLKLKTTEGKLPVVLEEFIEYIPI